MPEIPSQGVRRELSGSNPGCELQGNILAGYPIVREMKSFIPIVFTEVYPLFGISWFFMLCIKTQDVRMHKLVMASKKKKKKDNPLEFAIII